ncbi:uncharacterized protein LOC121272186 [Carcharodon carcharias]|uniref:uncharacterized protein LOC121272186 n=1 Tax=Carcharodon carcharias TaxID=13397 RepID=UPI001B7DFA2B|nr:uncharacterized protein LOC121272186 [Carcharodon carcharias]XP_041034633.1 uncharacterized protein LOC121272186 [Carcharodon carcharias]
MKSVSLLVLAFLCARKLDATELNDEVLAKIVNDFRKAQQKNYKQFSFLLALNPKQCNAYEDNLYINANISSGKPHIDKSPNSFTAPLNYIAVYPNPSKICSEYKILFMKRENQRVAVWFANNVQSLKNGGCVIFYTENTPCTKKCFSGKHFKDITEPLLDHPFDTWRTDNNTTIHKYFVYGQVYRCDQGNKPRIIHHFRCLDEFEIDPAGSFLFRKCSENKLSCGRCDKNNDYCVNLEIKDKSPVSP